MQWVGAPGRSHRTPFPGTHRGLARGCPAGGTPTNSLQATLVSPGRDFCPEIYTAIRVAPSDSGDPRVVSRSPQRAVRWSPPPSGENTAAPPGGRSWFKPPAVPCMAANRHNSLIPAHVLSCFSVCLPAVPTKLKEF